MPKAFIMIDAEPGHEKAIKESLRKMAGIKFVYEVTGEHDMISLIDTVSENDLGAIVASVRRLSGIKDTTTELVLGD